MSSNNVDYNFVVRCWSKQKGKEMAKQIVLVDTTLFSIVECIRLLLNDVEC